MIQDEQGNEVQNPDLELGYIVKDYLGIILEHVIDSPAEYEEKVIAEYPETGGKDVATVIVKDEVTHWEARDEHGKIIENYDGEYPEGFPDGVPIEWTWEVERYIKYTQEELDQMAEAEKLAEENAAKVEAQQQYLETAPARTDALEEGVDVVYDALAELGEEVHGGGAMAVSVMSLSMDSPITGMARIYGNRMYFRPDQWPIERVPERYREDAQRYYDQLKEQQVDVDA